MLLHLDLDHANSDPKLLETNASEWLDIDVRELPPKFDKLEDNLSSIDVIMDEVITCVDVCYGHEGLGFWSKAQGDGGLVVHH